MKTKKINKKVALKVSHEKKRDTIPFDKKITKGEFEAQEELTEQHYAIDDDWKPERISKGADEEG